MARVNVNKATREELVEIAGVRPQVADAILKARDEQGGLLAGLEALTDVKGIGAATLEQLKDTLEFGTAAARQSAEKAADATTSVAQASTEGARRATDATAEIVNVFTHNGPAAAASRVAEGLKDAHGAAVERSSEATTELGRLMVELMNDQLRHNMATFQALSRARSWQEAASVQGEFVRGSFERMTRGTGHYLETMTRLLTTMVNPVRKEATRKAA